MSQFSVFKPAHPTLYSVICDSTVLNSIETDDRLFTSINTREWTDTTSMYVMLKYRLWQMKDRRVLSLHSFHQKCTEDILQDLGVNKTPTQIRDKVNNTRSSFLTILKKMKNSSPNWSGDKRFSLSKHLFQFMSKFFSPGVDVTLDEISQKLDEICLHHQRSDMKSDNEIHL
ncbi:Myb/SANT-like domain-containing protein [Entamoeba marina]